MKEELQGKLVEILTSIQTAAGKASDFALEQLPDIAQSYVAYGRAASTLQAVLLLGLLVTLLYVAIRLGWANKDAVYGAGYNNGERYASRIVASIGGTFGSICVGVLTMHALNVAVLVWMAPKVWLLKEIASLLK